MKFPPAQPALEPLHLADPPRIPARKLQAHDLDPTARLVKHAAADTQHDRLTKQAQTWVAQTFFGTLLKQMENSPFRSDLFSGGRGGQAFSSLYHQRLAEDMARGAGAKLVQSIVRRIEAKAAYGKQQLPSQQSQGVVPPAPAAAERTGVQSGRPSNYGRRHVDVAAAARA